MWKIRPPKLRLPKLRFPVLTAAEKTALATLLLLLAAGAGLRAWERSGVSFGPVDDWDSLRRLVIRSRAADPTTFACAENALSEDGFTRTGAQDKKPRKAKAPKGGKKAGPARPLDLNTATEKQLVSLPGVGPSTARAIVAWRAANGKFRASEDLLKVKGIGPKKFEALQSFVRVTESAQAREGPPPDSL